MASDVATFITASGNGFLLGVTTVAVDEFGNKQRIVDSGSNPSIRTEQFTKNGFNDFVFFNKLKDRFDDISYYG